MTDFFKFRQAIQEKSNRLDPVDDTELDKKFKNRDDKDIDNDGDVDDTDKYLHKRRKAIDKAMDKESGKSAKKKQKQTNEAFINEASTKELKDLDLGDDVMVNGKMGMFYGMQGNKVKVRFPSGLEIVPAKDVEIMNLMMDELEKDDDDPCWDGYVQVGTKMKNGKEVPKCVPMEEAKTHMKEEFSKLLDEKANTDKDEAVEIISKSISMKPSVVKAALKDGGLDPVAVVTALKGRKTIKAKQLSDFVMGHSFGGSVDKKDLASIKKASDKAFRSMKEEFSKLLGEAYDYPDYGPTGAAEMAMTQLHFIRYAAEEVMDCLESGAEMPEWYQNKITKVHGDMEGIHSYMEGKKRYREMYDMPTEYVYDMDDGEDDMDMDMDMDDDMDMGMYEETDDFYQMFKNIMDNPSKDIKRLDMKKKPQQVRIIDLKDRGDEEELDTKGLKASDGFAVQIRPKGSSRGRKFKTIFTVKDKKEAEKARKEIESGSGYQMRMFESKQISEKLSPTDDISDWIKDFKDSDAPQFQGKSEEERKDMAIAAYYDARDKAGYDTPQQGKD